MDGAREDSTFWATVSSTGGWAASENLGVLTHSKEELQQQGIARAAGHGGVADIPGRWRRHNAVGTGSKCLHQRRRPRRAAVWLTDKLWPLNLCFSAPKFKDSHQRIGTT